MADAPTLGPPTDAPDEGMDTGGFPMQAYPDKGAAFGIPEEAFPHPTWMGNLAQSRPYQTGVDEGIFRMPEQSRIDPRGEQLGAPLWGRRHFNQGV